MSMEEALGQGMEVFDRDGVKIGEVDRVLREASASDVSSLPVGGEARFGAGYLQVGARVPGLGRTLYIPFSAIIDVDDRGVSIDVHKDAVENRDWDLRPATLPEQSS